jgi:hypothetical protein
MLFIKSSVKRDEYLSMIGIEVLNNLTIYFITLFQKKSVLSSISIEPILSDLQMSKTTFI